ncbi:glycosyltransferase family 2 protein [uncultured Friedmanniella sp.]|uniref:glycosyltransferase family 2 protein n=1 Tax=uncultured Friedmanniella sp. TaxID=335381 RepID=UPI0035CA4F81
MRLLTPRASTTPPTVTVVVPCYKYGSYLAHVVATTLDQPGVAVDIIIVDDASPDGSGAVAHQLAEAHAAVTVLEHRQNLGHIQTYNDGLARATGKYVVLLSADDLLAPGSLARATALMEHDPSVGFVYGYSPDFQEQPPPPRHRYYTWSTWSGQEWIGRLCRRGSNVVSNPEVVMRRSVMDELEGYDPRFPHTADLLVWLRAATRGRVGRVNGPDQGYYRVHGANMHLTEFSSIHTDLHERARTFEAFLSEGLADHPRQPELKDVVRRALATEAVRWAIWTSELGPGGTDVQEYRAAALDLWPAITNTSIWHRYQRSGLAGGPGRLERLHFQVDWELRHKLRWRRWRRFGT